MKHFLITRFNLRASRWQTAKDGSPVLTEKWLENRFHLFETYCLPSVQNQTQQNFIWLVFFDINTPEKYRDKAYKISQQYSNFHPVFIDGIDNLKKSLIIVIKQFITDNREFLITSRLDNDDIIHKDYMKTIQSLFRPIDQTVIDLRRGYQVTLGKPYSQIRKIHNVFNPYLSLIEDSDNFKTVFHKDHKKWRNSESVVVYQKVKLWCEIVHGGNLLNSTNDHAFRCYSLNPNNFGQKSKFFKDSKLSVFLANNKLLIRRALLKLRK
jgi:hypothetical protein